MRDRIRLLVADVLGVEAGTVDERRDRNDFESWDSLNHLRIVSGIEEEFGIRFGMDEIEGARSVRDLVRLVDGHLAGA